MATLRDLGPQPFQSVSADIRPAVAPPGRWVVLTDGTPISVAAPGTTLEEGTRPPCVIVAPADLDQAQAYVSAAFEEYAEVVALVLIEGSGDLTGVVGGDALERALVLGPRQGWSASVLPGPVGLHNLVMTSDLRKLRCCPWRAGQLAKAIHVLHIREA